MTPRRVVLAKYFVAKDDLMFLLAGRADFPCPAWIQLPIRATDVRTLASQFEMAHRKGVSAVNSALEALQQCCQRLVSPLGQLSRPGDIIWFVPHGCLNNIPLHAAYVEGVPFIERNPVCYTPSASLMKYCRTQVRQRQRSGVIVGDPGGDLPYAALEAESVAEAMGLNALIGSAATREAVLSMLKAGSAEGGVLHFACHGVFDGRAPLRSAIILAGSEFDEGTDSLLTAEDVFNLRIGSDLVTLSGCWTAVSGQNSGDDFLGLCRAFVYAGTASIAAALWAVNDLATAFLMRAFYRNLFRSEVSSLAPGRKAVALQAAIVELRHLTVRDVAEQTELWLEQARLSRSYQLASQLAEDLARLRANSRDIETTNLSFGGSSQPTGPDCTVPEQRLAFDDARFWAPFILIGDWG